MWNGHPARRADGSAQVAGASRPGSQARLGQLLGKLTAAAGRPWPPGTWPLRTTSPLSLTSRQTYVFGKMKRSSSSQPQVHSASRFCNWSGEPGEVRAGSRSKCKTAAEVWPPPSRARLGLLSPRQGCGGATHRDTALRASCLLGCVLWSCGAREECPGKSLSRRISGPPLKGELLGTCPGYSSNQSCPSLWHMGPSPTWHPPDCWMG